MDQHEDLQELLTRLNNVRDSLEEALGYVTGIEDDYRGSRPSPYLYTPALMPNFCTKLACISAAILG